MIWIFLLAIPAYLIGTIPFAPFVAKLAGHDIYAKGSGNPGASNVARIAGWKWGALAMALDILKGFVPTLLAVIFLDHVATHQQARIGTYLIAAAAIAGHVVPVGRKGGKGIATGGGAALALMPIPGVIALCVWVLLMKVSKLPVVASLVAAVILPVWIGFDHRYVWEFIVVLSLYAIVFIRHIPNIRRLIAREESGVTKHGRDQYQSDSSTKETHDT